jgi:hypothetical protein
MVCITYGLLAKCEPSFRAGSAVALIYANVLIPKDEKWFVEEDWVCPVSTDCLPLSHSTSSHSIFPTASFMAERRSLRCREKVGSSYQEILHSFSGSKMMQQAPPLPGRLFTSGKLDIFASIHPSAYCCPRIHPPRTRVNASEHFGCFSANAWLLLEIPKKPFYHGVEEFI